MRIFLAGASGVIGQRLIPRLVQAGHVVGGLTRSPSKTELLSHLGAEPILCDVFDREALIQAVRDFKPDVVLNELTDLPDDAAQISELAGLNARIRTEGNQNLIEAARRSGSPRILAQSVAWQLPDGPDAQAVAELERERSRRTPAARELSQRSREHRHQAPAESGEKRRQAVPVKVRPFCASKQQKKRPFSLTQNQPPKTGKVAA